MTQDKGPPLDPGLVHQVVLEAHNDLAAVKDLLEQEATLVNASWDWGGGDWETALGSASHMGRRDIALFLLEHGARMDIFAAAMLGETEIVRAMLHARPELREARGPHGIPLVKHAEAGGEQARDVLELLQPSTKVRPSGSDPAPAALHQGSDPPGLTQLPQPSTKGQTLRV